MAQSAIKDTPARQRAEAKFAKAEERDKAILKSQRQLQDAEAAKLVRLRSLRLAKEAADKTESSAASRRDKSANGTTRSDSRGAEHARS